ncbi:dephospho-CoA kinase [Fluoribacter gormanii]|uniref:Dephospho-CoA kinase n=1 Tax=Fluoribacter gormanii TaxID=464 RepID=A0A377GIS1_9GAMM|nr:dephospho-CoA kinase [Fluoribacter gormanii]KTD00340.1 dephospho-CoA kinase [Fluoribacter gormanii]MCW8443728.1 dephospho-CoA kinase [Fluoribacter gormanii]MCW8472156.1 dephospho-CoA kinase [Fluoribacter gormanii]SIQ91742.1 dephospho-CoA kinase [Fluoribacter gormanii]STO24717.1 Dephospho-CoA kinase [Fluoribacter gormanii]
MVYCVGLTGDIASGKTTVAELFSNLGIDVIYADKISRELTQKNELAYKKILEHYGHTVLKQDKELDRSKLREIIFSNHKERDWLERLLHPLIRQEIKRRVETCTTPYCMVEIPLLITKQAYPYINRILLVCTTKEIQIARLMQRDQCSMEQAQAILSVQPDINIRLENADDVINNHMKIDELTKAVNDLHATYLRKSKDIM